jgi:anti-sigma B factor antagonist
MSVMKAAPVRTSHLSVFQRDGVAVVVPAGPRLDAEVAGELRGTLLRLIDDGARKLIVDLPAVDFIDSSGLGALVSALKRLKQTDPTGDIRLADVQPPVRAVLEIIRLHRVFSQFASVDEAIHSFEAAV